MISATTASGCGRHHGIIWRNLPGRSLVLPEDQISDLPSASSQPRNHPRKNCSCPAPGASLLLRMCETGRWESAKRFPCALGRSSYVRARQPEDNGGSARTRCDQGAIDGFRKEVRVLEPPGTPPLRKVREETGPRPPTLPRNGLGIPPELTTTRRALSPSHRLAARNPRSSSDQE